MLLLPSNRVNSTPTFECSFLWTEKKAPRAVRQASPQRRKIVRSLFLQWFLYLILKFWQPKRKVRITKQSIEAITRGLIFSTPRHPHVTAPERALLQEIRENKVNSPTVATHACCSRMPDANHAANVISKMTVKRINRGSKKIPTPPNCAVKSCHDFIIAANKRRAITSIRNARR